MPPVKRKPCCVPHCPNSQEESKKQFFRIGNNLVGSKVMKPKSQMLYCCEDHFDLPNEAVNYIRYKYCPNTKLKLRPNILPHKKLPVNVCRLCLNLIYNGDELVDISEKNGAANSKIITTVLPELDYKLTIDPVVCMKCFDPLQRYYKIKQNVLRNEVVVVNTIKTIVQMSPRRLVKSCEIDLFEEYNYIKELLGKEKEKVQNARIVQEISDNHPEPSEEQPDEEKNDDDIFIELGNEETKYHIVELVPRGETLGETNYNNLELEENEEYILEEHLSDVGESQATQETRRSPDMQYEMVQESTEAEDDKIVYVIE